MVVREDVPNIGTIKLQDSDYLQAKLYRYNYVFILFDAKLLNIGCYNIYYNSLKYIVRRTLLTNV